MIPDISKAFSWLEAHSDALNGISRGIERETLRVQPNGHLATTGHPASFGSALKHDWITTDFAETLLEFITPIDHSIDHMLCFLRDIHRHVATELGEDLMWPFSMPCLIDNADDITLAQYGTSNVGRMKHLYRQGLKNRYGALMQTISGIHYNCSLPLSFWKAWADIKDYDSGKETISEGYLQLIRNYYRFGWIIPYLFGASPAICASFLKGRASTLPFESNGKGTLWLPYATSLRLSDLGYTNKSQSALGITFNSLEGYVSVLQKAIKTPSETFSKLGIKDAEGNWLQLNTNVLQTENELYTPIRPKRVTRSGEALSDALLRGGIEYVEVRSMDINPFSPIGVNENQVRLLDLFLIWCILADAPEMSVEELQFTHQNWNRVVLEGRKPEQKIAIGCGEAEYSLVEVGKTLFADLRRVAEVLDSNQSTTRYQQVCDQLVASFDDPELTYSGQIIHAIKENGAVNTGVVLAEKYRQLLTSEPLQVLKLEDFTHQAQESLIAQRELEATDTLDFESYLASYKM